MLNYKQYAEQRTDRNKAKTAALINRAKQRTGWTEARPTATAAARRAAGGDTRPKNDRGSSRHP